jgi:hypothetical protein
MRWWIGLAVFCCACSGKNGDSSDTSPGTEGDSDTDADADADSDADADTALDTGSGPSGATGFVELFGPGALGLGTPSVLVLFYQAPDGTFTPPENTGTVTAGECEFYVPGTDTGAGGTTGLAELDAGDVTVAFDGVPVALTRGAVGWSGTLADWPAGASLDFSATGGEFPAFSATDLLTVLPAVAVDQPNQADSTEDLALTWSGASSGFLFVYLQGPNGEISCSFLDDGEGSVPASLLGLLGAGRVSASASRTGIGVDDLTGGSSVLAFTYDSVSWDLTLH